MAKVISAIFSGFKSSIRAECVLNGAFIFLKSAGFFLPANFSVAILKRIGPIQIGTIFSISCRERTPQLAAVRALQLKLNRHSRSRIGLFIYFLIPQSCSASSVFSSPRIRGRVANMCRDIRRFKCRSALSIARHMYLLARRASCVRNISFAPKYLSALRKIKWLQMERYRSRKFTTKRARAFKRKIKNVFQRDKKKVVGKLSASCSELADHVLSACCPVKLSASCPQVVGKLSASCRQVVGKFFLLSVSCPQVVGKLSASCPQVVGKLSASCRQVVGKLSASCPHVVRKLSIFQSCPRVVGKLSASCRQVVPKLSCRRFVGELQ